MSRITLKPLEETYKSYEWYPHDPKIDVYSKYALVGINTQKVHAMFLASSDKQAKAVWKAYDEAMEDAGYTLMLVEE